MGLSPKTYVNGQLGVIGTGVISQASRDET